MTALFVDLVGYTQMLDGRDPEELLEGLAVYRSAVRRAVESFGGFILHHLGDGVVVCFGYPIGQEDAAARAVEAGLAIVEALSKLEAGPVKLNVRVGVASGLVVSQSNPDTDRIEDNFTGPALNVAARLQALAEPGQVVMAQSTARLVPGLFTTRSLGPQVLKGFADPVETLVVTGRRAVRSRFERRIELAKAPLVDRQSERDLLKRLLGEAASGSARYIEILGEPGIGKSRLAHVLSELPIDVDYRQVGLQCNAGLSNTVLHPHIELLERQCEIAPGDDGDARLGKLRAFMDANPASDPEAFALLASLLSISSPPAPPVRMPPPEQRARTIATLEELLLRPAEEAPLVVVYEDVHWADPTSRELLADLVDRSRGSRVLLIATSRVGGAVWSGREGVNSLTLGRLTSDDSEQFVASIGGGAGLSPIDIRRVVERTDGVPLFAEEMVRMMQDSPERGARATLPASLSDLLTERLDQLGPARRYAQIGAIIGREFAPALLAAVADRSGDELREPLGAMLDSGLVEQTGGDKLKFKHALIQDAAYASILARPRRDLHARVAQFLTTSFAETGEREPEAVARHLTEAAKPLDAAGWWLRAGGAAIGRGSAQEAAALLQSGLDALAALPRDEAKLREELKLLAVLGPAHMVMKGPGNPDFGEVQRRAYETCCALPDQPSIFRITYGLALYHWGRAEFSRALPLAAELDAAAQADPTTEHILAAGNMNGMIRLHLGDARAARQRLSEIVRLYRPDRDAELYPHYLMDFGVFGRFYLAIACCMTGDPDLALTHAREAVELAEALKQPHSVGFSMMANCMVSILREDPASAREWASRSIPFASAMGFPEFVAFAEISLAWAEISDGNLEEGLDRLDRGIAAWRATGFENFQTLFGAIRTQALSRLGRMDEARAESQRTAARLEQNGERLFELQIAAAAATAERLAPRS